MNNEQDPRLRLTKVDSSSSSTRSLPTPSNTSQSFSPPSPTSLSGATPLYSIPSHVYMAQQLEAAFIPLYPIHFPAPLIPLIVSYAWEPSFYTSPELIPGFSASAPLIPPEVESSQTGVVHHSTVFFDHWSDDLRQRILAGWRLSSITTHAQRFVQGFSVTYEPPTTGPSLTLHSPLPPSLAPPAQLRLDESEQLVNTALIYTDAFDRLTFHTSHGRRLHVGGAGLTTKQLLGQPTEYGFARGDVLIDGEMGVGRILAFRGGAGKALHSLGCVWQRMYPRSAEERRRTATMEEVEELAKVEVTLLAKVSEVEQREPQREEGWMASLLCCARCWR